VLSDSCLIATLTGKMWQGRMFDSQATKELTEAKHAEMRAGRFNKTLLPDEPLLKEIKQHLAAMRHYHYDVTLPWQWKGGQLLPSALFMEYTSQMSQKINEFDGLADQFCGATYYNDAIQRAQVVLGDLFNQGDYPSPSAIRGHFYAVIDTDPVPSSGDIRVDLPNSDVMALKAKWVEKEQRIVKVATEHLWSKLHDLTARFADRTSDPDHSFHKTLTTNISEFTEILDKLNIGEDRFLESIGAEVAKLGDYNVAELRKDNEIRAEAGAESAGLLEKIKKQMEAFNA